MVYCSVYLWNMYKLDLQTNIFKLDQVGIGVTY